MSHNRPRGVDIIHVSLVHIFNTSFLPLLEEGLNLPTESNSCIAVVKHAKPGSICKRVHLVGVFWTVPEAQRLGYGVSLLNTVNMHTPRLVITHLRFS